MKQQICYFQGHSNQLKANESGRTMLEMLGVLGIMGIIMYGAVAGINYGMSTYKINQIYNEVQEVIPAIQDMYSWQRGYPLTFAGATLCDNDVFVRCSDNTPKNTFEGEITVKALKYNNSGSFSVCTSGICDSFRVEYPNIPEEICYRLQEMDWGNIIMDAKCEEDRRPIGFCPRFGDEETCNIDID